jgi:hypothetical protein
VKVTVILLTMPVPCKADPVRQAAFLSEQLQPLLQVAEAGQALVYFAAAHPTHNTRSTGASG